MSLNQQGYQRDVYKKLFTKKKRNKKQQMSTYNLMKSILDDLLS